MRRGLAGRCDWWGGNVDRGLPDKALRVFGAECPWRGRGEARQDGVQPVPRVGPRPEPVAALRTSLRLEYLHVAIILSRYRKPSRREGAKGQQRSAGSRPRKVGDFARWGRLGGRATEGELARLLD